MEPESRFELHRKVCKLVKFPISGERLPTNALLEMSTEASFVRENKADGSSPEKLLEKRLREVSELSCDTRGDKVPRKALLLSARTCS
jgi:hypothetical protein